MYTNCCGSLIYTISFVLLVDHTVLQCHGDDDTFSKVLLKLTNDVLGVQQFQDYLDSLPQSTPAQFNGANLVSAIAAEISRNLESYTSAVRRLRDALVMDINKAARGKEEDMRPCCNLSTSGMATDIGLRSPVDKSLFCRTTKQQPVISYTGSTLPAMVDNLKRVPSVKWQYFGDKDGLSFVYPATSRCAVISDPRFRPWYYATASNTPKDILIAIQVSTTMTSNYGSTGINKFTVAIQTARFIIETLNPNDRVGVLAFAQSVNFVSADNCYQNSLAFATPQNKAELLQFLNKLQYIRQDSYMKPAIERAFYLLNNTPSAESHRVRSIFLLTDGKIIDKRKDVLCSVQTLNSALDNSVVIMIFYIEYVRDSDKQQFLISLAQQSYNGECNNSLPSRTPVESGKCIEILAPDDDSIVQQIRVIYDAFINYNQDQVVFSVPYNDSLGLGLVSTACLPVIVYTQLKGVACTDISFDLIFNDVINFRLGQLSYAFLIDGRGRALLHPAVPLPETYEEDPVFIEINFLERSDVSEDILQEILHSMKSGGTGRRTLTSNLVLNRGSSQLEGVDYTNKMASYYWYPIPVMNVSMCLVVIDGEKERTRLWTGDTYPPVLLAEHVNIFNLSDPSLCSQWDIAALGDRSMVKLSPMSFVDPFNYSLVNNNRSSDTEALQGFLERTSDRSGSLTVKKGVRETVALTYKLQEIWKSTSDSYYWFYTLFRYIGTEEGVFRNLPGTLIAKEFDPTRRPWYTTAVGSGQVGKVTVSRPYKDTLSGQIILTLCHTIYEGSATAHSTDDPVFGVMGLDMTLERFYDLLIKEFEPCSKGQNDECFIIDRSGFVIVHKDYLTNPPKSPQHITAKESYIGFDLFKNFVMSNDSCTDYAKITIQSFWKVDIQDVRDTDLCRVYPVQSSNLFIVVPHLTSRTFGSCSCYREDVNGECLRNTACQCPCYSKVDYNLCSGVFRTTTNPCLPPTAPLYLTSVEAMGREQGKKLFCKPCNVPNLFTDERSCENTRKCCWNDENGCLFTCPPKPEKKVVNPASIVVPVVVGTLLVLILMITAVVYWRSRSTRDERAFIHDSTLSNISYTVAKRSPDLRHVVPTESIYSRIEEGESSNEGSLTMQEMHPIEYLTITASPTTSENVPSPRMHCVPPPPESPSSSVSIQTQKQHLTPRVSMNPEPSIPVIYKRNNFNDEEIKIPTSIDERVSEKDIVTHEGIELFDGGYITSPNANLPKEEKA